MNEDLPDSYDAIVIGTGMPECILAAAHARNGRQVLHIDRNVYYGGLWASFNFTALDTWLKEQQIKATKTGNFDNPNEFLLEGETLVPCSNQTEVISNVNVHHFIPEVEEKEVTKDVENLEYRVSENNDHQSEDSRDSVSANSDKTQSSLSEDAESRPSPTLDTKDDSGNWTMAKLKSLYRKFNLDLTPKLLFSRGELVELLISSNISRYAEFKAVTRVLTYLDGKLQQVPCSRADVFSTKDVSIVEKRMLMKLLTYALNYEQHLEELKEYENKTFLEFLKSRKLTDNIIHYMINAIAMIPKDGDALEGLKATRMFLNSLGRYGNTPFLWPLYGSGEIPQCFCRLCAVFGGIYYLKRDIEAIVIDANDKCTAIISDGKRLSCKWLVLNSTYAPANLLPPNYGTRKLSKAIVITDSSLVPADKEQLTILRFTPSDDLKMAVTVIEVGPSTMVCPQGLYVVYISGKSVETAEKDLMPVVSLLFDSSNDMCGGDKTVKPKMLWVAYFNQIDCSPEDLQIRRSPSNICLTSPPNNSISFDDAVNEARSLFQRAFPDEEFLPRAPDPEEIVIEGAEEANPDSLLEELNSDHNASSETEVTGDIEKATEATDLS